MIRTERRGTFSEKYETCARDVSLSKLKEGRPVFVRAWGTSMYPLIKNGDLLKVAPCAENVIRVGDVVAVAHRGGAAPWFVVHRVVRIEPRKQGKLFFTRGDNGCQGMDAPAGIEQLVGKVALVRRGLFVFNLEKPAWGAGGRWIAWLSLRAPAFLAGIAPLASLCLEARLLPLKLSNRFKKGIPLAWNAEELLLLSSSAEMDAQQKREALELIRQGLDWLRFVELAMSGGCTVLVYKNLRSLAQEARLPQKAMDALKAGYATIVSRTHAQHAQLRQMLKAFGEARIPVIPLKGLLLAQRLYGDLSARGCSVDFDFLVREKDKDAGRRALEKMGYDVTGTEEVPEWHWQYLMTKRGAPPVDLHWDITMMNRLPRRIDELWSGAREIETDGVPYTAFSDEDLLLYLAVHLVNSDGFKQWRYLCDIRILLTQNASFMDWPRVIQKAKAWKTAASLYSALRLLKNMCGVRVPPAALAKLRPNIFSLCLITFFADRKVMFRPCFRRRFMDRFLRYIFFELIEADSFSAISAVFGRVFFPPKEILEGRNPIRRIIKGIAGFFG